MLGALGEKRFDARMRIGRHWVRPRHMARDALEQVFFPEMFDYAFMFVRNPVHRVLSEYRYQSRKSFPRWQAIMGFDRWLAHSLRQAAKDPCYRESHFRPQSDFRVFDCEVFRIEEGLDPLVARLSEVTGAAIPADARHLNRTEAQRITMSRDSLGAILRTYAEDFRAFGYPAGESDYQDLIG
jgi:Sulfotransferase family